MEWFIAVVAVAALGVAAMAAAGGLGQLDRDPVQDTFRQDLPDRPLTSQDLRELRLGVRVRGYDMVQVDQVIERLAREVAERDARLAEVVSKPTVGAETPREAYAALHGPADAASEAGR